MNANKACDMSEGGLFLEHEEKKADDGKDGLRLAVTNIILELGVPANVKGYFYLREAIILKVNNPDDAISMTKTLYPSIAAMFNTSAARVEHAMRHAIKVAWDRGDMTSRLKIFSAAVSHSGWKPTNSEFIATIVDRLKLNYN